jgi:hypothetical protein
VRLNRSILEKEADSDAQLMVDEALLTLSESQREAVILCHLCGFSLERAALELNCRRAALKARLSRGMRRIVLHLMKRGIFLTDEAVQAVLAKPCNEEVSESFLDRVLDVCLGRTATAEPSISLRD